MPLTNTNNPTGYVGPSTASVPVSSYPGGAVLYVNSLTGKDQRSRLTFQGTAATVSQSRSAQGPYCDPNFPLASVFGTNGALSYVQAGRGDLIVVAPSHSETLATGAGINVPSQVSILGLGYGSGRPTFQFTNAATFINSNGAGIQFQNCLFDLTGVASLTKAFQLQHSGVQFLSCRILQSSATNQATDAIVLSAGADDFLCWNTEIDATGSAGAARAISNPTTNNINRPTIAYCFIHGDFSTAPVSLLSTGTSEINIEYNTIRQVNAATTVFNFPTGNTFTGMVSYNDLFSASAVVHTTFIANGAGTRIAYIQNFGSSGTGGMNGKSAILIPDVGAIP